jgi:hypothetical protein
MSPIPNPPAADLHPPCGSADPGGRIHLLISAWLWFNPLRDQLWRFHAFPRGCPLCQSLLAGCGLPDVNCHGLAHVFPCCLYGKPMQRKVGALHLQSSNQHGQGMSHLSVAVGKWQKTPPVMDSPPLNKHGHRTSPMLLIAKDHPCKKGINWSFPLPMLPSPWPCTNPNAARCDTARVPSAAGRYWRSTQGDQRP